MTSTDSSPTTDAAPRLSTGVPGLDRQLGGGLLPGSLTVVVGATGIGKTQLGIQFAHAGLQQEQRSGVIFDLCSRGDSQSHAGYAQSLFNWQLQAAEHTAAPRPDADFFTRGDFGDYLHVFDYRGQRVTRRDLNWDQWHDWQAELNRKLGRAIEFLYGNFVTGCRRVVLDGLEPVDRPQESIQWNLVEYVYHQIVRKDPAWVARDLFRQRYRELSPLVAERQYEPGRIGCLLLATSRESMLDDLIDRPLDEGDSLANANTLIYMGKVRDGNRIGRGLLIAKHRGSACSDQILPYRISDTGLELTE